MSEETVDDTIEERTGLQILDRAECIELIAATPIGRIGFISYRQPVVLPVNYRWFDSSIVFRTLEGDKLHAAAMNQPVAFEIDEWDATTNRGWSVVVKGLAHEVTNWAEAEQLEQLGLVPWSSDVWRQKWVRVVPDEISGRRVR